MHMQMLTNSYAIDNGESKIRMKSSQKEGNAVSLAMDSYDLAICMDIF